MAVVAPYSETLQASVDRKLARVGRELSECRDLYNYSGAHPILKKLPTVRAVDVNGNERCLKKYIRQIWLKRIWPEGGGCKKASDHL